MTGETGRGEARIGLQWGRGRLTADDSCRRTVLVVHSLQWGRGQLTADDRLGKGRATQPDKLQWGRGRLTADDAPRPA